MHETAVTAKSTAAPQAAAACGLAQVPEQQSPRESLGQIPIQYKLTVGAADDPLEREADEVAERVMRMPENFLQNGSSAKTTKENRQGNNFGESRSAIDFSRVIKVTTETAVTHNNQMAWSPGIVQRKCAACEEEDKQVRRKPFNAASETSAPSNFTASLGNGQPLDDAARNYFEPRFGSDFSSVKVHTGPEAAASAKSINAKAYTLGNSVVFGAGEYQPGTEQGKRLLAHELTHVVQQENRPFSEKVIKRQHITLNSGREVGDTGAPGSNLKEDVLEVLDGLHSLWSMSNPDYASEYPAVGGLPNMSQVPKATIPLTISAIKNNEQPTLNNAVAANSFGMALTDTVGTGMKNAKPDIYLLQDYLHSHWLLSNADYTVERTAVNGGGDPVSTAIIPKTLAGITQLKTSKVASGTRSHDAFGKTKAISAGKRSKVEAILIPGATVGAGGVVNAPAPDAVCSNPANLKAEIRATLVPYINSTAAAFRTRKANPPILPMAQMNSMADIVEDEIESYFGTYLKGAHHVAGAQYAPGSYRVKNQLKDQSATFQWQNVSGRTSWVNYWISGQIKDGKIVNHHCSQADLDNVAADIATDAALIPDIDTTVQSWPAEATGGININPYLRDATADPKEKRKARWDAFTTILHEAIHHLAHPNFIETYSQFRDESMQILKEGFNDLFRQELWSGPGKLKAKIAMPAYDAKRAVIEGGAFNYEDSVVEYHGDYDEIAQAREIEKIIGNANAKAAYFLGHTEYLGLGAGSGGLKPGGSLGGIASYHAADPKEEGIVDTVAGESYDDLVARINAKAGTILDTATGKPIPQASPLPAKVKVAGIRHYTAIKNDTLNSVADQNGVTPFDLVRANKLTTNVLTVGKRLLIPIH